MSLQAPVLQIASAEPQTRLQARKRARWAFVAAFASLVVAIIVVRAVSIGIERMEKRGAGLLLVSDKRVLLLLRRSAHNDNTWGLPGGNAEPQDTSLQATALREATEELGAVPPHTIRGSILTKRGKFNNKQYTVFLAEVSPSQAAGYNPVLNEEHREWRWFPAAKAAALPNLHPVVDTLFSPALRNQVDALVPGLGTALGGSAVLQVTQEGPERPDLAVDLKTSEASPVVSGDGGLVQFANATIQGTAGLLGTKEAGELQQPGPHTLEGETGLLPSGSGSNPKPQTLGQTLGTVVGSVGGVLGAEALAPLEAPSKRGAGLIFL
eukprot:jgi/Botrbrau1/6537/Bobra.40_2s0009.2